MGLPLLVLVLDCWYWCEQVDASTRGARHGCPLIRSSPEEEIFPLRARKQLRMQCSPGSRASGTQWQGLREQRPDNASTRFLSLHARYETN